MGTMERERNGYVFSTVQDTSERWRLHTCAHLTEIRQNAVRADSGAVVHSVATHVDVASAVVRDVLMT